MSDMFTNITIGADEALAAAIALENEPDPVITRNGRQSKKIKTH